MANSTTDDNDHPSASSSSRNIIVQSSSNDSAMLNTSTPPRPSLSTSLSDFALSSSSSSSSAIDDSMQSKDDATPLLKRTRRPTSHSLWLGVDQRVNSPLANTFTLPSPKSRKGKERSTDCDGDSNSEDVGGSFQDKDRMNTECSSPSSEFEFTMPSMPMRFDNQRAEEAGERPKSSPMDISRSASPTSALKPPADIRDTVTSSQSLPRRLSQPPKPARLLSLRAEAHPEDLTELEVKHEAQVQRLLASFSGLPPGLGSRTRSARNRGRYPEEAVDDEEFQREETPSDDEDLDAVTSSGLLDYKVPAGSDPINIAKPSTPAPSVLGTPDDYRGFRGVSESPGNVMDIDMPLYPIGSPAMVSSIAPPQSWRQTPPPTSGSSAVRTAKRKYDDRFEPYAPASKRRAVSPSISQLKDREIISPIVIPRSPTLLPRKSFSQSQANSATSSPTISNPSSYLYNNGSPYPLPLSSNGHHRSGSSSSVVSSPTVRASMILASPILRPVPRLAAGLKRAEDEKIVDGAGENLKELNIGRS